MATRVVVSQFFAGAHFFGGAAEGERLDVEAKMTFEPMLLTNLSTLSSSPRPIEETPMTTATPITMPSTVSAERSLLLRIVSVAIRRISPNSPLRIMNS